MKYLLIALLCALSTSSLYCVARTTVVAARAGYPDKIIALRNQAKDFLRDERIRMKIDVQGMRKEDLNLRADELTEQYKDAYFTLEDNIDEAFTKLSREFIRGADELDSDEAPVAEKRRYANQFAIKAQRKIDALIKRNEAVMRINPLNLDI